MLQSPAAVVGLAQVGHHSEALRERLRAWGGRRGEVVLLAHHQLWVAAPGSTNMLQPDDWTLHVLLLLLHPCLQTEQYAYQGCAAHSNYRQ